MNAIIHTNNPIQIPRNTKRSMSGSPPILIAPVVPGNGVPATGVPATGVVVVEASGGVVVVVKASDGVVVVVKASGGVVVVVKASGGVVVVVKASGGVVVVVKASGGVVVGFEEMICKYILSVTPATRSSYFLDLKIPVNCRVPQLLPYVFAVVASMITDRVSAVTVL
jgi:hypothetical protein